MIDLPIDLIRRSPFISLDERPVIIESEINFILENGFVGATSVRKISPDEQGNQYEILDDEKPWMIAQAAGIEKIPCHVHTDMTDEKAKTFVEIQLTHRRKNKDPIHRARQARQLLEKHQAVKSWGALTRAAAEFENGRLKKGPFKFLLNLLELPDSVQKLISTGKLKPRQARLLHGLIPAEQMLFAKIAVRENLNYQALADRIKGVAPDQNAQLVNQNEIAKASPAGANDFPPPNDDTYMAQLEDQLESLTGQPTRISFEQGKGGVLSIRYFDLEELDGILQKLGYES